MGHRDDYEDAAYEKNKQPDMMDFKIKSLQEENKELLDMLEECVKVLGVLNYRQSSASATVIWTGETLNKAKALINKYKP